MNRENTQEDKKRQRKRKLISPASFSDTTNKPTIDDDAQECDETQPNKRKCKLVQPDDEMVAKPKRSKKVCRNREIWSGAYKL